MKTQHSQKKGKEAWVRGADSSPLGPWSHTDSGLMNGLWDLGHGLFNFSEPSFHTYKVLIPPLSQARRRVKEICLLLHPHSATIQAASQF